MTTDVGGSTMEAELERMSSMREGVEPVSAEERWHRIEKAQRLMRAEGVQALYLDASTSLFYFTGMRLRGSERLHGAIIPADGDIAYICPAFEEEKTRAMLQLGDDVRTWEEHEDPTALVVDTVRSRGHAHGTIAVDEATPFFTFDGLRRAGNAFEYVNADLITAKCRMIKSAAEIALMQRAKNITLEVHKATARILAEGLTTTEVADFIAKAHTRLGVDGPLSFCIVLFG